MRPHLKSCVLLIALFLLEVPQNIRCAPIVIRACPRNGNFGQDTTNCDPDEPITGGYEYVLFKDAWATMSDAIKSKYQDSFQPCRSYGKILTQTKNGTECDVTFGSITAAAVGDRANLSFYGTSLNGALIVAVKKGKQQLLAATAPFSTQTKTIIILICCLFVGAWILDFFGRWVINCWTAHQNPRPFMLAALRNGKGLTFFGTSLMVLVAIITVQLLFSVFCSYLTSALLLDNPGGISSVADLKKTGKPIWTTLSYKDRAKALGFRNVNAKLDPPGPAEWYDLLVRQATIGGILLDDIVLINFAQAYPEDVYLLKEPLAPYSLGFYWNEAVPKELTKEFERAVRALWDGGYVEQRLTGLLSGGGFSTYTFGSNSGVTDNTDKKFNVLDVVEFKTAFIGTLVAAGLVFAAELIFQIVFENRERQQAAAGGNGDVAAGGGEGGGAGPDGRVDIAGHGAGGGEGNGHGAWNGVNGAPGNGGGQA